MNREKVIDILSEELGLVNYIEVSKYLAELETDIILLNSRIEKINKYIDEKLWEYFDERNVYLAVKNDLETYTKGDSNE